MLYILSLMKNSRTCVSGIWLMNLYQQPDDKWLDDLAAEAIAQSNDRQLSFADSFGILDYYV